MNPPSSIGRRCAVARLTLLSASAATALITGCAAPVASTTDSTRLAQLDQLLQQASPGTAVALEMATPQVKVGQTVSLRVGTAKPGYLYLYHVGTNGKDLSLSFPNAMDGANYLPGGTGALTLPRANWQLSAKGPAGTGYFVAVVTDRPQDLMRLSAELAQGRMAPEGPYGAAMATLREVAP